jgi:hypothetical protein
MTASRVDSVMTAEAAADNSTNADKTEAEAHVTTTAQARSVLTLAQAAAAPSRAEAIDQKSSAHPNIEASCDKTLAQTSGGGTGGLPALVASPQVCHCTTVPSRSVLRTTAQNAMEGCVLNSTQPS